MDQLRYSRIEDHNRFPQTDTLYNPLRKILLHPEELTVSRGFLNPAAAHSRVTRDYAYLSDQEVRELREKTFIPVDQQLVATQNFDKIRGTHFMAVDAQEFIGNPISAEQMQRIRSQGYREQRVLYDFGNQSNIKVSNPAPPQQINQIQVLNQTRIIKQELKSSYRPPEIEQYRSSQNKYKYNLYSMLDEVANGHGCGCPANQIIASKNQPQSINWLN